MYKKGAKAERELASLLEEKGYAVVRSAGSGNSTPDIIAIKDGKVIAFECKAWKKESLTLSWSQYKGLSEWQKRSGVTVYIAWKYPRRGWLFVPLSLLEERNGNFVISYNDAKRLGRFSLV